MDSYLGEIRLIAFNVEKTPQFLPNGWLPCDGRMLSVSSYQPLFALIGVIYGGNGTTDFALPDLRGRLPLGCGQGVGLSNYKLGEAVGKEQVALTTATFPSHTHAFNATRGAATSLSPTPTQTMTLADVGTGHALYTAPGTTGLTPAVLNAQSITNTGAGASHLNVMPVEALQYMICCSGGLFPQV